MPHKSVRRTLGFTPHDLYREYWHPDRDNIFREKCKVLCREQKILICELLDSAPSSSARNASTSSSTSPPKWLSFSTIRRLFKERTRTCSVQTASSKGHQQPNEDQRYKIIGKIHPDDKSTGVFKGVPAALMALESPAQCPPGLILDVRNYLAERPHGKEWRIRGALPKSGQAPSITTRTDRGQPLHSREAATAKDSLPQIADSSDARDQRRFVLLEHRVRCNCEESFHPRHRLRIFYKPGYTPDPQKIAEAKKRAERNRDVDWVVTSAATNAAVCSAAVAVCAAGC
ncbi:uncharacterized protein Z520_09994 [Fonsecaea multimorphosa CBS 102226]|uniref:Uncharacterized protein n=1 Tax=Fonsecaea multimorphosa CBS 102226 TaxID=1442371 RepID=A0A0D2JUS9_9EURO|nr:uncharacterized protein Z520_09994 [Fonsecaea multimorphosa CBS 102226]KIX94284.1 hypothetical protein Z520_09994 [Fonsecaea multimorphosa CBS 102226]OAL19965.1 hypothetical protein AYO22_09492 [Fonsecaea multimorphosa]